jgi:hypothetical protein
MFSFLAGSYNFPYLMDVRRPGNVIPFNYPTGQSLRHLKCFKIVAGDLVALERDYQTYSFEKARLSSYRMS